MSRMRRSPEEEANGPDLLLCKRAFRAHLFAKRSKLRARGYPAASVATSLVPSRFWPSHGNAGGLVQQGPLICGTNAPKAGSGLKPEEPMPDETPETKIPLIAERLNVSAREVEMGRVRVETRTELVEELAKAELDTTDVDVVRVPVDQVVTEAPPIRTVGTVTIIPVLEEVLVIEKRLILKEELHVTRRVTTKEVSVPVTLRKQRATVTRS